MEIKTCVAIPGIQDIPLLYPKAILLLLFLLLLLLLYV